MATKASGPTNGHTILVVDDQADGLLSLRHLLEREGHRVLAATSGEEALALLRRHEVHLLLVDDGLPGSASEALVRAVRQHDPLVPIVLQSRSGQRPPRQLPAELDIQGYHATADGPEKLLLWVQVGVKAWRSMHALRSDLTQRPEVIAPRGLTSHSLNDLVGNFLLYTKLETRALRVEPQWTDLDGLVRECRELCAFLLEGKAVCFNVEVSDVSPKLWLDASKVRTALGNLLGNAAKLTARGAITLRIAQDAGAIRFEVGDTGAGLPAEALKNIFDAFRQGEGVTRRPHDGMGLGLALARKLARLLGGDLTARSVPGAGSTFVLTIPLAEEAGTPLRGRAHRHGQASGFHHSL